jgi:hypothetical protein
MTPRTFEGIEPNALDQYLGTTLCSAVKLTDEKNAYDKTVLRSVSSVSSNNGLAALRRRNHSAIDMLKRRRRLNVSFGSRSYQGCSRSTNCPRKSTSWNSGVRDASNPLVRRTSRSLGDPLPAILKPESANTTGPLGTAARAQPVLSRRH